jgi:hypothetical protein
VGPFSLAEAIAASDWHEIELKLTTSIYFITLFLGFQEEIATPSNSQYGIWAVCSSPKIDVFAVLVSQ